MPSAGGYLFLLGLACGVALLTITSYRRVSPWWLRWLLFACGVFVISLYAALAVSLATRTPTQSLLFAEIFTSCWFFAGYLALALPSIFAIDQLLRHPSMTPKKLLGWLSPFLAVYILVLLFRNVTPPSPVGTGNSVAPVVVGWYRSLLLIHSFFVISFVSASVFFMRKVPSPPIRLALLGLVVGQSYLGVDGLRFVFGPDDLQPFLYSHLVMLLALWHAYETSAKLQSGA